MRKKIPGFACFALLAWSGAAAALDPQAGLYYEIPLGGVTAEQKKPKLSLRVDRYRREGIRTVDKRALFDMRLDRGGVEAIKFRGKDLLD